MLNASPVSRSSTRAGRRGTILVVTATILSLAGLWLGREWWWLHPTERFVVATAVDGVPRTVRVEAFLPTKGNTAEPLPAIVLLHGVEGASRYRSAHHRAARRFADQGYAVFFVHYFSSGDYDDLWMLRGDGELDVEQIDSVCRRDAACWTTVVLRALTVIASRRDVDRSRIAIDGNSLGGFVALSVEAAALRDASVPDPRAIVVNWGGLFETTRPVRGFAPTLFIHGEYDPIVPLESARRAAEAVRAAGSEASLFVIPGAPHVAQSKESDALTKRFLREHLSPESGVAVREEATSREAAIGANLWVTRSTLFH